MSMKMTMAEFVGLEPCPFCGGEADVIDYDDECWVAHQCANGTSVETNSYDTEAEAIAAWNSRAAKPCYAADANYERCKYGVNRGWCDDAPFLVWDDTGHLFITMGGLKTWDVTDDARKWSAAHGTLTAEQVREAIKANAYPETSTTFEFGSSSWQEIADELNSRAERTCRIEETYGNQYCTCCGEMVGTWDSESELCVSSNMVELWNYCPNCGARRVGE